MTPTIGQIEDAFESVAKQAEREAYGPFSGLYAHLRLVIAKTWNYAKRFEPGSDRELMNIIFGLCAEAGEVADVLKKYYCHTEKDNWSTVVRKKLVYELGDVLFYWLKLLDRFGITVEEVVEGNREKLASRHPELGEVTERFNAAAIK
jgi:NTP pyrophosphatase (non-canonical NTP hydrolase)